jgi:hypothetical protein
VHDRVLACLTHSSATLDVEGLSPCSSSISEIVSLIGTRSVAHRQVTMVGVWHCRNLSRAVTFSVSGDRVGDGQLTIVGQLRLTFSLG